MLPFLFSLKYHSNDKIFKSMSTNNFDSNEVTFQVDLNEATLAVKENRFSEFEGLDNPVYTLVLIS